MKAVFLSAVIGLSAGAAHAGTPVAVADRLAQAVIAPPPDAPLTSGLDLSRRPPPSRYASPLPTGIARTSIDHRFEDDEAVGSFGYLCGLNPGQKMTGAAGAAGYDPMGKFLGAKLSFAFR
jgi:hypothetical protein